tara:strand:+ start:1570 stop:3093 length:1524 start_codon:yes stop_codon:yes gene_type:complete
MSGESKTRDRVPTLQDFMDKDFEIKQIDDNISRANTKIKKADKEIKKMERLKKKYNNSKQTQDIAENYFLALDTGMDEDDFNSIFNEQEGISGMFSLLNSKMDDKIRKKTREISTLTNYIEQLDRKKVNVIQYRERTASQAAQKAAQDAIVPEAIKAVENFDKQLSKFQTYSGRKLTLTEKYNNQVDATHRIFELNRSGKKPVRGPMPKSIIYSIIDNIYKDVKRGKFNYEPRNSSQCWEKLKKKLEKSTLRDKDEYPDLILPLIYKTLIFCIPFTRQAISLKSQAEIRINQLPDVIESEAPEDIKNLKLSFDYLKAELQNLNSNIEMFNSIRFLECMITIAEIQRTIPQSLKKILPSIISNFPVETDIESKWLEITNLYEKIKKMEKIRREMSEFYDRRSPEEIMKEDAERDINSWRLGSGTKPLTQEEIRALQRQMYRNANKPFPKWLKPKNSNARTRAKKEAQAARKTATQRLKRFFGKRRGGRRKKTRKKRRKSKRTRKKRRK